MSGDNDNNGSSGRSLGGGGSSEPLPSSWSQPSSARRVGRIGDWNNSGSSNASSGGGGARISSLRDLQSSAPSMPTSGGGFGGSGGASGRDDDDDDDDGPDTENWFTGGERSGLSVQNPNSGRRGEGLAGGMVDDLLRRAARAGPPPTRQQQSGPRMFMGGGHTLGSDEVESTYIPDPNAVDEDEPTIRRLTFWRNGFTVEDGDLYRYDDPNNEEILQEIHAGRAPPSILDVRPGEPVELRVSQRTTEDYVPPPAVPFSGAGQRLGAPVPEVTNTSTTAGGDGGMPGSFPVGASGSGSGGTGDTRQSMTTMFEVDQTKPTTSVQVRLADGTRMVCRMNLTHTVRDLRNFINASRPENLTRPYTIGTTFPNRTLEDDMQTLEDAGLKNSVVVQRWV
ncbi:SEP-domain-containing protein [Dendrothele bispora CBS 962.96]|uniref:SEP-domain-containing protein n=1 Tax=Dendrothele bispora (strain CBS 962.96) TaxID=1314807 RepID=A0A4S8MJ05_DENBC|nr:SEP-domain-containing protein [Dendrothele bispora CBS 962.96]